MYNPYIPVQAFCKDFEHALYVFVTKIWCTLKAIPASCDVVIKNYFCIKYRIPILSSVSPLLDESLEKWMLSKMPFFLIAGLSIVRLQDKSKLIKYVDTWSAFLLLLRKFWNAAIRFDFTPCGSLQKREIWWGRPAAGHGDNDCPVSILGFPKPSMVCRTQQTSGKLLTNPSAQRILWQCKFDAAYCLKVSLTTTIK